MTGPRSIHWLAPCLMLGSFAAGVGCAAAHHFFYDSLIGQHAETEGHSLLGTRYSGQQLNIAIGTALAFLVKTFLVLSVSTAFCQVFWRTMKARSHDGRPPRLGDVDTIFASATSIVAFLDVRVWLRYPYLILLALLVWQVSLPATT
jgi:hypothetical protein